MGKNKIIILIVIIGVLSMLGAYFFVIGNSERKIMYKLSNEGEDSEKMKTSDSAEQIPAPEENQEKTLDNEENKSANEIVETIDNKEGENKPAITEKESDVAEKASPAEFSIENKLVSSGFATTTKREIDTIIIHSSYNSLGGDEYDTNKIIEIYKSYGVSAHYLMGREGEIIRLVEDKNIAYHAGISKTPDGRSNVNDFSIGIEMVGNKTDGYTRKQYEMLSKLLGYLKGKYEIKYVLGHKDIAPDRKDDPWSFDWDNLN